MTAGNIIEIGTDGRHPCGWPETERELAASLKEFEASVRQMLADHQKAIETRLAEQKETLAARLGDISRLIEKKVDREYLDLQISMLNKEIDSLTADQRTAAVVLTKKAENETLWKVAGLTLTLGAIISGILQFIIHLLIK